MSSTYDFIIVGGGTAGCLIANRLVSSKKNPSVLIIETGDHGDVDHRVPYARYLNLFTRPDLDHGYLTAPQVAVNNNVVPYVRGKGMGGSSMINFMIYTRGAAGDYDEWAELVGSDDWSWDTALKRFHKIENFTGNNGEEYKNYAEPGSSYHQNTGTVGVSIQFEEETAALMDAAYELGWQKNLDLNSGNPIGVGPSVSTLHEGMRSTSSSAHIQLDTPNLTIMVKSQATKILFEGTKAIGVEINGKLSVYASKEVILSAGAIDTPKLLLLSGVGPAKELEALDINVIKDLPGIGKNMQDHCGVFIADLVDNAMSSRVPFIHKMDQYEDARKQWDNDRTGPLATHYKALCLAFLKQDHLYDTPEFKSLSEQLKSYLQRPTVPMVEIAFNGPTYPPGHVFGEESTSFCVGAILLHPESRGSVALKSSNPFDPPIIDPNYLSHPFDRLSMIAAIREARRLVKETSLKKHCIQPILAPEDDTDEAIWEYIKGFISSIWHASSTVSMGKADDPMACVDASMNLHGMQNIRVADVSVCPLAISGHTQSVAYQIGQAAAEKIVDTHDLNA
ncbi:hypothetical protein K450DRAFT_285309 [Umbelopsis ramanniana AG]|uniref:Glucose-methanol-choline oxidoreductase N-terminal domain-containing protein n=1 Tax=Umbelopsis ramanniana AG TaxID=1314678 RepID=A0AAD5EF21_UMBRA|nr:uncharacterized protein K450DRAFT_285309 [Umbelopsis ramanniana AG]KAI8582034.1 hypothetical protein K450DRAFT_285309 [Umbelopsis ramanniana AG]